MADDNKTNISKEAIVCILSIISASIKFIYSSKYFDRRSMWYKIEKICLPCVHFRICLVISLSQVMGGLVLICKRISFLQDFCLFFCWYHCKHIFDKRNSTLVTDLLKVKNNMFLLDNDHTQKRRYSVNTHPWTSVGCFSWQLEYGYSPLQIYFKKDC